MLRSSWVCQPLKLSNIAFVFRAASAQPKDNAMDAVVGLGTDSVCCYCCLHHVRHCIRHCTAGCRSCIRRRRRRHRR
uniref:Putative secreted protein n=1 Tax=Anopheles marajoara TaxID=58244 RepID=A0A2M4CCW8_9DIPT